MVNLTKTVTRTQAYEAFMSYTDKEDRKGSLFIPLFEAEDARLSRGEYDAPEIARHTRLLLRGVGANNLDVLKFVFKTLNS